MIVGAPRELNADERRAALTPDAVTLLSKLHLEVLIESGLGVGAGFPDEQYQHKGARIAADRADVFAQSDLIVQVRCDPSDAPRLKTTHTLIGHCEPLIDHAADAAFADTGATVFAMELVPRITRAQGMDALSSQANLVGYKGVLLAAEHLAKAFPMMMTAAGTIKPAKVFIVGAGVAGLQAIATAKRLGAVVSAIDVRPAVKEQVESLGAKFVMPPSMAEGAGGYAAEMTAEQKQQQQQMMADTVADSDVVVTTAAIPGRPSPKLIAADVVARMRPGSVIVDLASERGGNCELTHPGQIIEHEGITIVGLTNVPSLIAHDATIMYAGNLVHLLRHLVDKEGRLRLDLDDPITAQTLLCRGGRITHAIVRQSMGLEALEDDEPTPDDAGDDASDTKGESS